MVHYLVRENKPRPLLADDPTPLQSSSPGPVTTWFMVYATLCDSCIRRKIIRGIHSAYVSQTFSMRFFKLRSCGFWIEYHKLLYIAGAALVKGYFSYEMLRMNSEPLQTSLPSPLYPGETLEDVAFRQR